MQVAGCIDAGVKEAAWFNKYPLLQAKHKEGLRQSWHPVAHEAQVLMPVRYCALPQAVQVLGLLAKHLTQLELQVTQVWLLLVLLLESANPKGQYLQLLPLLHCVLGTQFWRADD